MDVEAKAFIAKQAKKICDLTNSPISPTVTSPSMFYGELEQVYAKGFSDGQSKKVKKDVRRVDLATPRILQLTQEVAELRALVGEFREQLQRLIQDMGDNNEMFDKRTKQLSAFLIEYLDVKKNPFRF